MCNTVLNVNNVLLNLLMPLFACYFLAFPPMSLTSLFLLHAIFIASFLSSVFLLWYHTSRNTTNSGNTMPASKVNNNRLLWGQMFSILLAFFLSLCHRLYGLRLCSAARSTHFIKRNVALLWCCCCCRRHCKEKGKCGKL